MSPAAITRSGGFSGYGCRVFGPARTIRLCQRRSTPNISAARSRIASLASTSRTPGAMMPARLDGGEQVGRLGLRVQEPGRADALVLDQAPPNHWA